MATFEVTKETITVYPHPNADRLELAQVGLYRIVVAKGLWKTGDKVLYIPEYSVLPEKIITEMGLEGKLAGSNSNRVKPVKLRGQLSQGLVAPLSFLPEEVRTADDITDFAEALNITKWEPEVPTSMSGDVSGNYDLISWIDIENIKKFPDMFTDGEHVIIDEKIHGTASLFTFLNPNTPGLASTIVSSKGLGAKKLALQASETNVYWRVLNSYKLNDFASQVQNALAEEGIIKVGVFGETFGSNIQDLHYGHKGSPGFRLFDIYVESESGEGRWLNPDTVRILAEENDILMVPRLYEGPYSLDTVIELANGKEQVSGQELHIREGVVVRPQIRSTSKSDKIGKYVSEAYLTRKAIDGVQPTEYN